MQTTHIEIPITCISYTIYNLSGYATLQISKLAVPGAIYEERSSLFLLK